MSVVESKNYKVSVILPIFNVEKYLENCLNSLLNQTYSNIEIIMVDDGSPDNCGKIIDNYELKDSRFKTIHKANGGVSSAKNAGLNIATGDYICFVDPDDYVSSNYVEYLLSLALLSNSDVSITKEMFTTFDMKESNNNSIELLRAEDATAEMLLHKIPIGVYCKIFKKAFLDKYKIIFDTDIFIGEGFYFNTMAFKNANSVTVGDKRVYYYRTDNQDSAVTKFNIKKWENAFYALECIESNLSVSNKKIKNAMNFAKWYDGCFVLSLMSRNKVLNVYPEMVLYCKKIVRQNFDSVYKCNTNLKNRIKAILMALAPVLFTKLLFSR